MKSNKNFKELGLSEKVLEAISKKGFEEPSPIQELTIPVMLRNNTNIIAQAQTGTGKTAAFGLPLMDLIDERKNFTQALVLAPTRELAIQVSEEMNSFNTSKRITIIPIYGGQSIDQQLRRLQRGAHIVVGTPGRIIDHLNRKTLDLSSIEHLIIDEADEMLNMGFIEDLEKIMIHTKEDKRTLLFSATMPAKIKELAKKYIAKHEFLAVKNQQDTQNLTEQIYYEVKQSDKFEVMCRIIDIEEDFYGLIFCRTKNDVDDVTSRLLDRGYDVDAIHGDISQAQREKTLLKFRNKRINIMVATDVAARGIDISNLSHVINYSLPQDPEAYIHRIGRTGRAGNQGTAITFITPSEYRKLMFIQKIAQADIKKNTVPKVKDIINNKKKKITEDISSIELDDENADYLNWANSLIKNNEPNNLVAKMLYYFYDKDLNPSSYSNIEEFSDRQNNSAMTGQARLFVALGKKDKYTRKTLVDFIVNNTNIKPFLIQNVDVYDNFSFICVPFKEAEMILKIFKKSSGHGKPLVVKAKQK
jgi:ATP-dependent RNA helicase DeaD